MESSPPRGQAPGHRSSSVFDVTDPCGGTIGPAMQPIRAMIIRHAKLAAVLLALVLCMRAAVPAGYMVGDEAGTLTVSVCSGVAHGPRSITIDVGSHQQKGDPAKDIPCAFTALAKAATDGADAPLLALALALAFILALGFVAVRPMLLPLAERLRPPLRGPPRVPLAA